MNLGTSEESTVVNDDPARHTPAEQQVIEDYKNSVDEGLVSYYNEHRGNQSGKPFYLRDVGERAASDIQQITGQQVTPGFRTVLDARQAWHINNDHGESGKSDHSMADPNDVGRMQFVLDNYDTAEYGGTTDAYWEPKENGKNRQAPVVVFSKKVNGTYYVVEAVPVTKAKTVNVVSAYMLKAGRTPPGGRKNKRDSLQSPDAKKAPWFTAKTDSASVSPTLNVSQTLRSVNRKDKTVPTGKSGDHKPQQNRAQPAVAGLPAGVRRSLFSEAIGKLTHLGSAGAGLAAKADAEAAVRAYQYLVQAAAHGDSAGYATALAVLRSSARGLSSLAACGALPEPGASKAAEVIAHVAAALPKDPLALPLPVPEQNELADSTAAAYNASENAGGSALAASDGNRVYFTSESDEGRTLISEVQSRGDKISPAAVIGIARDSANHIVWLEQGYLGKNASGLAHIYERHEAHFNGMGIASKDIPDFVLTAACKGDIVGYQGQNKGRAIYRVMYRGRPYEVAITIGSNGYIVGANPVHGGGNRE